MTTPLIFGAWAACLQVSPADILTLFLLNEEGSGADQVLTFNVRTELPNLHLSSS